MIKILAKGLFITLFICHMILSIGVFLVHLGEYRFSVPLACRKRRPKWGGPSDDIA